MAPDTPRPLAPAELTSAALPATAAPSAAARQRLEEEHRALRELLILVEETSDLRALLPRLEALERVLAHHFASEEAADGLHAAIDELTPERATSLELLFREHRDLLALVAQLVHSTRECLEGPIEEVRSGVADLVARLHLHEQSENELFVDALQTELGGGG